LTAKISVVIPTFNSERTIAKCLQSIRNQERPETEIIVVDSLSKDSTIALSRALADSVVELACSATRARLLGTEKARGQYVLNLDSDQQLVPGVLERALALDKPAVAFGEMSRGRGIVARANHLANRVRDLDWVREVDPEGGSIVPRLYPRDLLLQALKSIPPSIIDLKPMPYAEDSLIFSGTGLRTEQVGFVGSGIVHREIDSVWAYWKKWVRNGRNASSYRGTAYEGLVWRRGKTRLRSSLRPGTLPAFLLRFPPFTLGYLS
jgi:glycosyltransferase involved in cell wall biosynthesis